MRFRDALTLHTCPLLLRVTLAVIFMWAGFPKFGPETFKGEDAATLVQLGIGQKTVIAGSPHAQQETQDSEPSEDSSPPERGSSENSTDQPPEGEPEEIDQPEQDEPSGETQEPAGGGNETPLSQDPAEDEAQPTGEVAPARPDASGVEYEVRARKVEGLTIMLHRAGHPSPRIFAWIAMLTESIGGALLLIGLFSRVWGLGLAIAMAYAFVLASLPAIQANMDPTMTNQVVAFFEAFSASDPQVQSGALFQLILFVASWCIFIGGPGALSLDRLIFRPSAGE